MLEIDRLEAPEVTHGTVVLGEVRMTVRRPDGAAIEGAQLSATRDDSTWTTDVAGVGYIAGWPLGPLGIRVSAIGFAPRLVQLQLSERRRLVDTVIVLQPVAQPLAPLTVTGAPTPIAGRMIDFERRRAMGFGSFLTRADLEKWSAFPLSMALRDVRGLAPLARSWACGGGFGVGSFRGHRQIGCVYLRACPFSIYLDGVRVYDGDGSIPNIDDYLPDHLEGIEVYRGAGEAPIEFNATGGICGTVVLWSRVSPATANEREPPDRGGR